jgi:hypothetical protein
MAAARYLSWRWQAHTWFMMKSITLFVLLIMGLTGGLILWSNGNEEVRSPTESFFKPSGLLDATPLEGLVPEPVVLTKIVGGERTNYADPVVIKTEDGRYRLFLLVFEDEPGVDHSPRNNRVETFISDDGVRFDREEQKHNLPGYGAMRFYRFDEGLRLYYSEFVREEGFPEIAGLFSLISQDGLQFLSEDGIRIRPLRDLFGIQSPTVFLLSDGRYRMVFGEFTSGEGVQTQVFYGATSVDGLSWVRDEEPLFQAAEGESGQVLRPFVLPVDDLYYLFYNSHSSMSVAVSSDGWTFERLTPLGLTGADTDGLLLPDGTIQLYYGTFTPDDGGSIWTVNLDPGLLGGT